MEVWPPRFCLHGGSVCNVQLTKMGEELAAARETVKLTGQPQSFLLEQLQTAKRTREQLEAQLATVQAAFQAKEQAAAQCAKDRDALKADLDVLLQQRGQMDSLKSMLMHKLQGGPMAATGLASGIGPQRIAYPTTVITGQGSILFEPAGFGRAITDWRLQLLRPPDHLPVLPGQEVHSSMK
eukprot:1144705-Pelagomonas_calceolata.AAC.3